MILLHFKPENTRAVSSSIKTELETIITLLGN